MKHLDSIQNLGEMDILCTDKTGTLTLDRIILERHCDLLLRDDPEVIRLEWLVSHFQEGVRAGRKVFVNILKYVRMGTSSNFGNMLSVLAASAVLPFVPMTPLQILTTNLLYDCSQVPIPGDHVDAELVAAPRPWSTGQIARFILCIGPVSSLFDFTTFAVLWFVFGCDGPEHAAVFHTGWIE